MAQVLVVKDLQVDPITSSFRELSSPCSQFFPASSKPVLAEFVRLPPDRRCASFHFGIVLTTADNLSTGVDEVVGIPAAGPDPSGIVIRGHS